ncbi:MAG TPA: DedA family protein [Mycobacteriales bacterium]|nr:DedA family protein [Mycobacteriales bacterium]
MEGAELTGLTGWVIGVIDSIGAVGVGALIALESVFPPIPSEVVLPLAGFSAARGQMDPVAAWAAATVGAVLGAYVLYAVGALVGFDRVHQLAGRRWFVLFSQADLSRGERLFDKHGSVVVLLGRCLPFVRSVVSVPAGFARMPLWRFTALTAAGSGVWNAVFIYAGYELGARWHEVGQYLQPFGIVVGVVLTAGVVLLAARRRRQLA